MGLRHEIEGLGIWQDWLPKTEIGSFVEGQKSMQRRVLAILDKYEVVAEYVAPQDVSLCILGKGDDYADGGLALDFEAGDTVTILKRGGEKGGGD